MRRPAGTRRARSVAAPRASGRRRRDPARPRFRFFGGKGGVGKTTCAAAAAIVTAERGRRVLLVSTDPAHSLGDALGIRLGPRASAVRTRAGRLDAAELDAERALGRWLAPRRAALAAIAERGTYLDDDDIDRLLRLSLPGVDELVGLVELARLARAGRYDEVVVDTAPTGHTLRLLAMPETVGRIAAVLDHMYAKHRFLAERLAGAYRPDASDAVIAELEAEGRALRALLQDRARCVFSWILLPEALSVEEAADGVQELDHRGIAVQELIVNRVTPRPVGPCALCGPRRRVESRVIEAIRRRFRHRALRLLPDAAGEPRGLPALRRVGRPCAAVDGHPVDDGPRGRAPATVFPAESGLDWPARVAPTGTRLLLVLGKGGVGKTTCAAAAALALAGRPGRRILLLSADPAHSLGDVLGLPLGDDERPLPGGRAVVRARELDADAAFAARRNRYRAAVDQLFGVPRPGAGSAVPFDRAVVHDLVELAPPGVDELFALLSVSEALLPRAEGEARYDLVVLDTAPTGHALRLLALVAPAREWVRALLAILLKYREVARPGRLAAELLELSRALGRLERLLHEPRRTRALVVTGTGRVVGRETARLLDRLGQLGIAVPAVVLNRAAPDLRPRCRRCARALADQCRDVAAARAAARRRDGETELFLAPTAVPPPHGPAALRRWARTWRLP